MIVPMHLPSIPATTGPAVLRMKDYLPRSRHRMTFDATAQLREQTRARLCSRHAVSRLNRYSIKLLVLHDAGSSTAKL